MTDRNEWVQFANCATTDGDIFFAEKGGATLPAKRICSMCTVRAECLEEALRNNEEFGIWAGTSRPEREQIRRGVA